VKPTVDAGSITAGGTDNAFEATGDTTAQTVTFQTAFANKPVCTCTDETAAAAVKCAPTTTTVVITKTTGDSIGVVCLGK